MLGLEFDSLLNKKIVIRQNDGFKKYGILIGESEDFIQLKFEDGNIHFVQKSLIAEMKEDGK